MTATATPTTERELARILLIDDEQSVLDGLVRMNRREFALTTAADAAAGIAALRAQRPFAVVFCDYRMPGMNGAECLEVASHVAPDTVRAMLTGNSDQATAVEAINRGNIFRLLSKPCDTESVRQCARAGIELHARLCAERDVLERTVRGSVQMLCDILALTAADAYGSSHRATGYAVQLGKALGHGDLWELEAAAMLSCVGMVSVPQDIAASALRGDDLGPRERAIVGRHVHVGYDLVRTIPRLEKVAEIVLYQGKRMDGGGLPMNDVAGQRIPLGSRILHVARSFDALICKGHPKPKALQELAAQTGCYDPAVLEAARQMKLPSNEMRPVQVAVTRLVVGQILNQDVVNSAGSLVVSKGQVVTESMSARLRSYAELGTIPAEVEVLSR
jgi:response regulator RpfG family c-di-GMP phosphodiesterase